MSNNIYIELLKKIKNEFNLRFIDNKKIEKLNQLLFDRKATYQEANELAVEVGKILKNVFGENITENILEDGVLTEEIANILIRPNMMRNYDIVSTYSTDVQQLLNRQSDIGLKAMKPPINKDRIDGIVKKIAEKEFNDTKWLLGETIINFTQSVVDDTIKHNTELQYKSGLRPKIKRKEFGKCCDWCRQVVGEYEYPDVPDNVYKRHRYCRCTVEYLPGNGKAQDVWSKKWKNIGESDKIKERIKLNKESVSGRYPETLANVKRGKKMSFEEANSGRPNPKFEEDDIYKINCQTCVVAFEARSRGYDVQAKGNFAGSVSEMLSRATNKAWIDPKTGKYPEYIQLGFDSKINTPAKYVEYLEETLKENTRYTMQFGWKGRGNSGHIVNIFKGKDGLKIYDPQTGESTSDIKEYLERVEFTKTIQYIGKINVAPKLLEVENYNFNVGVVNKILEKAGG